MEIALKLLVVALGAAATVAYVRWLRPRKEALPVSDTEIADRMLW